MQLIDLFSKKLAGSLLISLLVIGVAHAKDDGTDHSLTIERENHSYVVNADGGFVSTHDRVWRINEERAIKSAAQQSLNYNHTLESLDVVEAYTQKADGRKVMVLPEQIKDQQERQSSAAPMFQDTRVKVVIYSEVAVGDQLILKYTLHRTTALFPGQFEDLSYPDFHPTKQLTITYDMPDNLPLLADAKGFTASTPLNVAGRKIYQWTYVPGDNARIEQGAVSYLDYGKYLAVSTFANVGAFAHAYDSRAKDKSGAEEKITELAHKITGNVSDPRAKAIALDDWVRKNIRYVAVYIGAGGVVPHAVDTILDNRYGDCKDHVALLEALLAAAGIDSTPALINSGNAYTLPKVFTLGLLNHVITYIPSLNLYLDSTAESIAGGYLPAADLDKPVVLTKAGKMAHTPSAQNTFAKSSMVFKISASGAADFTLSSIVTGWLAEPSRHSLRNTKPSDRKFAS
jgi:transglutaminase-like putative cysteine protease